MRIRSGILLAGMSGIERHADPLQHRHSKIALVGKVLDQPIRTTTVPIRMKNDRWIELKVYQRRIRPGDRHHFFRRIRPSITLYGSAPIWGANSQMASLVKQIAGKAQTLH